MASVQGQVKPVFSKTEVALDGEKFIINNQPTYEGISYLGRPMEGLMMNSRMIQAVFDDDNPETAEFWKYPDTGAWNPDRNTDEFCAMLPEYRRHGILAVTVGFQAGGSRYGETWENYRASAYNDDGSLKPAWLDRMQRVIKAADDAGVVVIANYFYWKQARFITEPAVIRQMVINTTEWLLNTGYRNIIVDIANECANWWKHPCISPDTIGGLIEAAKSCTKDGRRLLVSSSTGGGDQVPTSSWLEAEDFTVPHGNGCSPESLKNKIRIIRDTAEYKKRPRPLLVNECSVDLNRCLAAVDEYCSWGYYSQGAGSDEKLYDDQWGTVREAEYENLSGFQVVPVNWGINTPRKKLFFDLIKDMTQGK